MTLNDVVLRDLKNDYPGKPKHASPSFKFSSELQQGVDQDLLLAKILNELITVKLHKVLSSYELAKRMQKIPSDSVSKVPIASATTAEEPEEVTYDDPEFYKAQIGNLVCRPPGQTCTK
jgi:hypothetical protein